MVWLDIARRICLECHGFATVPEFTTNLARTGHRIAELPITNRPCDRDGSKKIRLWAFVEYLWALVKFRFLRCG